jgi:hypothetical protein
MFLPNQLFKGFRAPFARQDLVTHLRFDIGICMKTTL